MLLRAIQAAMSKFGLTVDALKTSGNGKERKDLSAIITPAPGKVDRVSGPKTECWVFETLSSPACETQERLGPRERDQRG
jgi:hypothetical protein